MAFHMPLSEQLRLALKIASFTIRQKKLRTNEKVIVDTEYGKVQGVQWRSIYGEIYNSFEGIPFAKPPIGELRFRAPEQPDPWSGVKRCMKVRSKPWQYNLVLKRSEGSEDCLYLNVYTKELKPTKPLPVLVWIYGGAFQIGETSRNLYSPDYLMMDNVVLISIAYRLGPFGFLSLSDKDCDVPGNAGLKDQIMALKWVKQNCKYFGGNPDNITIFGESAGAASVHFLALTDQTQNLFHRVVLMSGCALSPWAMVSPDEWAYRLAQATGYQGPNNDASILKHLRKVKPSLITKKVDNLMTLAERQLRKSLVCFAPCVEPYQSIHCVIDRPPVQKLSNAWSNQIPMLIGGTSFEGLLMFSEIRKYPELLQNLGDCEYLTPYDANLNDEKRKYYGKLLKQLYFNNEVPTSKSLMQYSDLCSYKYFWHGITRTVRARQKYSTDDDVSTYVYRFDFDSKRLNLMRRLSCGTKIRGTCHADDLMYLFYNAGVSKPRKDTIEYLTIRRFIYILTQFARNGCPAEVLHSVWNQSGSKISLCNGKEQHLNNVTVNERCEEKENPTNGNIEIDESKSMKSVNEIKDNDEIRKWLPIAKDTNMLKCLNISKDLNVINLPELEKLKVWDLMYEDKSLLY